MTDDQNNSAAKHPKNDTAKDATVSNQNGASSVQSTSNQTSQANKMTKSAELQTKKIPEPQIKKVDIAIAGVTYPIFCPVHEQEELLSAVSYINNYALDLKRDAPSLSQESILVLCCLNLYEKIHANQRSEEDRLQKDKQSEALLNKIMKDAHSIL